METPSATIDEILNLWRAEMASSSFAKTRAAGDAFERLCAAYLNYDPEQQLHYRNTRKFSEWAIERGLDSHDTGIDLVAELVNSDGLVAIQCKFHAEGKTIAKKEIDSFLAASGTKDFTLRIIIDTTGRDWSTNVEKTLNEQAIPVRRLGLHNLRTSSIDWAQFVERNEISAREPLELKKHQRKAVKKIKDGLANPGSRGKLIMACGTGKTLTSLRAAEILAGNGGRILYLLPSLALMSQTVHSWALEAQLPLRAFAVCSDSQVGKRKKNQDDNIDMDILDLAWPATTVPETLGKQASQDVPDKMTVIFATYQSSQVIEKAQREYELPEFDLAICDEAHRTASAIVEGEEQSNFTRIHRDGQINAVRRLYMTATPKVYAESARTKAGEFAAALCSMDDESLYGPVLYELGFAEAVEQDLLSDYRVVVLTVPQNLAAQVLAYYGSTLDQGLKIDDTALMIGCWRALAKADLEVFPKHERIPMKRAIAFCKTIKSSEQVERLFDDLASKYRKLDPDSDAKGNLPDYATPARHIDGTFNASSRAEALEWLDSPESDECRILTNARCLTEGVDLPALDGILFMHPRKSQIEVVQAIGRVMRKAEGKPMGYIILPVVIPPGGSAEYALSDNERWRKVWQMLNAIRSHDEGFDAELNQIEMGVAPRRLSIISLSDWQPTSKRGDAPEVGRGTANDPHKGDVIREERERYSDLFGDLPGAIMAKIVEKCGTRKYWDEWAGDVAKIARAHIERTTALVTADPNTPTNPDIQAASEVFEEFLKELRDDLNPGISKKDAIEMLAQHMVTGPVFDALFEDGSFTVQNPVSQAMQTVLDVIRPSGIESEAEDLQEFYESVRRRVKGAVNDEARQKIISELYDKFFRNAFAETSKALGIVYTPVEIVDFILHSVEHVLNKELGIGLGNEGVHILDPFTGTGTFITRLLQSEIINNADIVQKYTREIHANEIVLLAYYIASANIETAFHSVTGGEYRPFERICLTDTFQLNEGEDLFAGLLADNSDRRTQQKEQGIRVIIGNPPWNVGQKEYGYSQLYARIDQAYASRSSATLKSSLYDSYKLAIRWASDRIGESGIVGFVTNGSWLDKNVDAGIRASLVEEFSSIYVLDLRGDQRTQGDLSKREGGKVFGSGSRSPVAIVILVRNPKKSAEKCQIYYHDIGDYKTREQKLHRVKIAGSITGIDEWKSITPDPYHDWINQRETGFHSLCRLGSESAKKGHDDDTVFGLYSRGLATSRDAYLYSFSRASCSKNARLMIKEYTAAMRELSMKPTPEEVRAAASRNRDHIHWDRELENNMRRRKEVSYSPGRIWCMQYRPFVKQYCYVDYTLVNNKYQMNNIFPDADSENLVICVPGVGSTRPFSVLMIDSMPDIQMMFNGQYFPRYRYEETPNDNADGMFRNMNNERVRIDNISDTILHKFRLHYQDKKITKDEIFYYAYGILHAMDFKNSYPNALSKELARIPMAIDFHAFSKSGRSLSDLHVSYEKCPEFPLKLVFSGEGQPEPRHYRLGAKSMRYGGKRGDLDRSVLIINEFIRLIGIPEDAHLYEVNGRTPLNWLIDRYKVSIDKKSGIHNNVNEWFEDSIDLVSAIKKVVYLSIKTAKLVKKLPSV